MAWGAIIKMGMSLIGGAMSGKGEKDKAEDKAEANQEIVRMKGNEERRTLAYRDELSDYYSQKNKQRRRDARAASFGGFSTRTKFKEAEGFTRKPLVKDEAPGVPITKAPVKTAATYKKPSLLQRLTKPSLDPLGLFGRGPRGDQLTPGSVSDEVVTRERQGG